MKTLALISLNHDPLGEMGGTHVGGQAKYVLEIAKNLSLIGWSVALFTVGLSTLPRQEDIATQCTLYRVPRDSDEAYDYDINRQEAECIGDAIVLRLAQEDIQPDAVYGCYWLSGLAAMRVSDFFNAPMAFTFCQLGAFIAEAATTMKGYASKVVELLDERIEAESDICKRASAIIATNRDEMASIVRDYDVPRHKIHFIPRGIDLQRFYSQ